ncbi:acyltransferase [Curtobacterium sp. 'Ferrero']|nr:acyltransferase [Curtobacterium sp. 'Ferrero']
MPRLDSLTGLRAFAALAVFLHHATAYQESPDWAGFITNAGDDGVSFFFMLSGFVLAWNGRATDTPGQFYRRRAARILPLYWIAWIVGGAYAIVADHQRFSSLVPSVVLLQSWFPQKDIHFAGNSVGWSLSAEMFFYLMFPAVFVLLRRLSVRGTVIVAVVALFFIFAIPLTLHPTEAAGIRYWLIYLFPVTRFFEFVVGMSLAMILRSGVRFPVPVAATATFALAVSIASNWLPRYWLLVAATAIPFVLLLASAADADRAGKRSIFAWKPIVKLGEWSFAFYLVHLVVLRVVIAVTNRTVPMPWWATSALGLVIGVAVAAVLCEYVEKPLEKRLRGDGRLPVSLDDGSTASRTEFGAQEQPSR